MKQLGVLVGLWLAGCGSTAEISSRPAATEFPSPGFTLASSEISLQLEQPTESHASGTPISSTMVPTHEVQRGYDCAIVAGPDGTPVYSAPGLGAIGTLAAGVSTLVWNQSDVDGETWYQIYWNGHIAFVAMRDGNALTGDCSGLRVTPTSSGPPTPVQLEEVDYAIAVPGDAGTVWLFAQTIPSDDGDTVHTLEIRVDLLPEQMRWVAYELTCVGDDIWQLRWGWWNQRPLQTRCGDRMKEPISGSRPYHYLEIERAADAPRITYTLTVTVSEYSP